MKLIDRGVMHDRDSSKTRNRPVQRDRLVEVPASLATHALIYRGATYYKLSHQGITTFLINLNHPNLLLREW